MGPASGGPNRSGLGQRVDLNHSVVVLVGRVHRRVVTALNYARSLRPNHLVALYVASDEEERKRMEADWKRFGFDVDLVVGVKSLANILHGQSALALKLALLDRANTVVTSVPFRPAEVPEAAGRGEQPE